MKSPVDFNDLDELKKSGYIIQTDPDYYTVRLRIPAGTLTAKQLENLGRIANKFGNGNVHITVRQGIQIPYVKYDKLKAITRELTDNGTVPGSCGPRVRNITCCPGAPECHYANVETYPLANRVDTRFLDTKLPTKMKIAICGCPNSCTKVQLNDVGIMGVARPEILESCTGCGLCARTCKEAAIQVRGEKAVIDYARCIFCGECIKVCPKNAVDQAKVGYSIFVGGNVGRHPRLAYKLVDFASEETIYSVIENSCKLFEEEGIAGERLGHLIDRIGIGRFTQRVLSLSLHQKDTAGHSSYLHAP